MLTATDDLARRLDAIACDYLVARYTGPGNPMGTETLHAGRALATEVPAVPMNPLMNSARGLENVEQLREVLAFYAATQQACWVEVSPYTPPAVTSALIGAGFHVERYASTLYATPLPPTGLHGVRVTDVAAPALAEFLDTINAGFGTPVALLARTRDNQAFWSQVSNWHLFLAHVDAHAAGGAVLSVHEDAAYLAAAATLPAFRNGGVQSALIAARIARARALGCNLVTAQAAWGTSSQSNLQRAGLQISHVRTIWTNASTA